MKYFSFIASGPIKYTLFSLLLFRTLFHTLSYNSLKFYILSSLFHLCFLVFLPFFQFKIFPSLSFQVLLFLLFYTIVTLSLFLYFIPQFFYVTSIRLNVFASLKLPELITEFKLCKYRKKRTIKNFLKYAPENKVFLEKIIGPLSCQHIPCRPHSFTVGSLRVRHWSASNTHQPIIFLTVSSSVA